MKSITSNFLMERKEILIVLCAATALSLTYFRLVDLPAFDSRIALHHQILNGTAPSPYRYRVLVPYLVESLRSVLAIYFSPKISFLLSYAVYDFASISLLLLSLWYWMRLWFTTATSLIGTLFAASTMSVAFFDHAFQPWTFLEATLMSAALFLSAKRKAAAATVLVALGALNRETGLFLALAVASMLLLHRDWTPLRRLSAVSGQVLVWLACYIGLHRALGPAEHVETIQEIFLRNIEPSFLLLALINIFTFFGPALALAPKGLRCAPREFPVITLSFALYAVAILVWGVWFEVRMLIPFYPMIIPLALFPLCRQSTEESGKRELIPRI